MKLEAFRNPFWQAGAPARVAIFLDGNARGALRFFALLQREDAAPDDRSGFPIHATNGAEAETRSIREMLGALDSAGYEVPRVRVFLPRVEGGARAPRPL